MSSSIFQEGRVRQSGPKRTFIMFKASSDHKKKDKGKGKKSPVGGAKASTFDLKPLFTKPKASSSKPPLAAAEKVVIIKKRRRPDVRKKKIVSSRAKFVDKMRRVRGIEKIIQKKGSAVKFTPKLSRSSPCEDLIMFNASSRVNAAAATKPLVKKRSKLPLSLTRRALNRFLPGVRLSLKERIARSIDAFRK